MLGGRADVAAIPGTLRFVNHPFATRYNFQAPLEDLEDFEGHEYGEKLGTVHVSKGPGRDQAAESDGRSPAQKAQAAFLR